MTDGTRALHVAMATELDLVATTLEEAAVSLCLDADMLARHAEALQGFDRLAQTVSEIARLLRRPAGAGPALDAVRLDALRDRLIEACATTR